MLSGQQLAAKKGRVTLFQNMDFELPAGQWLFLSGGNGSGKTTLLRILCGLGLPDHGQVLWRQTPTQIDCSVLHREMMYVGHALGLKEELSAMENLRFHAQMTEHVFDAAQTREVLATLGLKGREHLSLRVLSQGQKRRVALAKLLLYPVPLWILDEPFVALDAQGLKVVVKAMQTHLQQSGLLVYTSHQRVEIDAPGMEMSLNS
jgi:heme exporter protein A